MRERGEIGLTALNPEGDSQHRIDELERHTTSCRSRPPHWMLERDAFSRSARMGRCILPDKTSQPTCRLRRVMTLAFNRSEPDVLYAGTVGAGDLPRRTQRRRSVELVTFQQWDAARCDCHETLGERFWHYLRGNVGPWRVRASPTRVGF